MCATDSWWTTHDGDLETPPETEYTGPSEIDVDVTLEPEQVDALKCCAKLPRNEHGVVIGDSVVLLASVTIDDGQAFKVTHASLHYCGFSKRIYTTTETSYADAENKLVEEWAMKAADEEIEGHE